MYLKTNNHLMTRLGELLSHFPCILMTSRTYLTTLATVLIKKNIYGSSSKFALDISQDKTLIRTYFDSVFTSFSLSAKSVGKRANSQSEVEISWFSLRKPEVLTPFRLQIPETTTAKRHRSVQNSTTGWQHFTPFIVITSQEKPCIFYY